jgi:microcystin-dependent protein
MSGIYVGLSSGNVGIGTGGLNAVGAKLNVTGDMSAGFLIGQVSFFTMSTAPTGWLKCNGAAISRTTYAKLFAVTGTTYGVGDGSTTFNLPDLRGEFIRGFDDGRAVDSGRTFGSFQAEDFKSHNHTLKQATGNNFSSFYEGNSGTGSLYKVSYSGTSQAGVSDVNLQGGTETRPRNRALLACIKF